MNSDNKSVLSPIIIKNLGEKLVEKRDQASLEIENQIKELLQNGDPDGKIKKIVSILCDTIVFTHTTNSRRGGLIGLNSVTLAFSKVFLKIVIFISKF